MNRALKLVDLFAKSEILDSVAIYCDAKGNTFLVKSGGKHCQKILKN